MLPCQDKQVFQGQIYRGTEHSMDFATIKELTKATIVLEQLLPDQELEESVELFLKARETFGWDLVFYLPGTIRLGNLRGRYPGISITGSSCKLLCQHCKGKLLKGMWEVRGPEDLGVNLTRIKEKGYYGALLTGGAEPNGMLPWEPFLKTICDASKDASLHLSCHTGFLSKAQAKALKDAGIRQGLLDVMGSDLVARSVYNLDSLRPVLKALEALKESKMELVPHMVAGLFFGEIAHEYEALKLLREYEPDSIVIVTLTPFKGTPMEGNEPPPPLEVARVIRSARRLFPHIPICLGCERKRGKYSLMLEYLAILSGINRMAVWSEEAVAFAKALGLRPRFQLTCCSVPPKFAHS